MPALSFSGQGRALTALAMHFQHLGAGMEAERFGFQAEIFSDAFVFQLNRALAGIADQERHRMFDARMMAGHIRVDRRQLVDEPVLEQEIQGAVNRRGRIGAHFGLHLLKQVVGLDRLPVRGDQPQHLGADRGQAQPALRADRLHRIDTYQKTYFVIDSFQQLFDATFADFAPVYGQLTDNAAIPAGDVLASDTVFTRGTGEGWLSGGDV